MTKENKHQILNSLSSEERLDALEQELEELERQKMELDAKLKDSWEKGQIGVIRRLLTELNN